MTDDLARKDVLEKPVAQTVVDLGDDAAERAIQAVARRSVCRF